MEIFLFCSLYISPLILSLDVRTEKSQLATWNRLEYLELTWGKVFVGSLYNFSKYSKLMWAQKGISCNSLYMKEATKWKYKGKGETSKALTYFPCPQLLTKWKKKNPILTTYLKLLIYTV